MLGAGSGGSDGGGAGAEESAVGAGKGAGTGSEAELVEKRASTKWFGFKKSGTGRHYGLGAAVNLAVPSRKWEHDTCSSLSVRKCHWPGAPLFDVRASCNAETRCCRVILCGH